MAEKKKNPGQLVFGLDIGTRSIVGTVGYRTDEVFHVVAQYAKEHTTRSMLDGQIHDIEQVGHTILEVKEHLESIIGKQLHEVCIAAAGRVLKTVNSSAAIEFNEDKNIDAEDIYTLEMLGVEKAYEDFQAQNNTDMKFYCVGYTVVHYYMNDHVISALERHKAKKISVDLIATFLPDEVVDGLYKAVEIAGLEVANLTLEPIAAMTAAIPVMYRMLNIALVDVGAGTSDISITKDGSIIAYGMIPKAGDELTEAMASALLLDFAEAEKVKIASGNKTTIKFTDIMGLPQKIEPKDALNITKGLVDEITQDISDKIKELNGDKPVSAVFIVGGGGKIKGFTEALAEKMGIMAERVALRGEEVLKNIDYQFEGAILDSMFVTPIGICLNFYEQKNNFIFVNFNGKRIKLYDNGHLTIVDAAVQAGFPNEGLFPKRGQELSFTVNDKQHLIRGQVGEPADIKLNGKEVSLNTTIIAGDKIVVNESTAGEAASATIASLMEYGSTISVVVNDKKVELPKFAEVNGNLQSEFYDIKSGDDIKMLGYYTVSQIIEFMDVILEPEMNFYVNNKKADRDTKVYDNFSVIWSIQEQNLSDVSDEEANELKRERKASFNNSDKDIIIPDSFEDLEEGDPEEDASSYSKERTPAVAFLDSNEDLSLSANEEGTESTESEESTEDKKNEKIHIGVIVNDKPVILTGKSSYMYVEIFDYIDFDLKTPRGNKVVTLLNGRNALYTEELHEGDVIEVRWE